MRSPAILLSLILVAGCASKPAAEPEKTESVAHWQALPDGRRTLPLAGSRNQASLFAERLHFPAGYAGQPHTHSQDLHAVVLSGRLYLGFGSRFDRDAAREVKPGEFVAILAGSEHFEWTDVDTVVHLQAVGPFETHPVK